MHPRPPLFVILAISMIVAAPLVLGACQRGGSSVDPSSGADGAGGAGDANAGPVDVWAEYEALEQRIAAGEVRESERAAVLQRTRTAPDDQTAAYAFARAAITGRVVEGRGLKALKLLEEMRSWCLESIERDPEFRQMAATRMLGTLYVLAGQHLERGDSEEGLELLESVVEAHPEDPVSQLRLAEGYIALGDPEPALPALCAAGAGSGSLSAEERQLLAALIEDVGGSDMLGCAAEAAP